MWRRYLEGLADGDDGVDERVVAEVREDLQGDEQRVARRAVDGGLERALDVAEDVGGGRTPEREEREGSQCLREAHPVRRLVSVRFAASASLFLYTPLCVYWRSGHHMRLLLVIDTFLSA